MEGLTPDLFVEHDGAIRPPLELLEALGMPPGTHITWQAEAGRLTFGPLTSYAQPDDDSATASTSTTASPVGGLVPAMDAMDATDGAARTNGKRSGRSKRQPQAPKQSVSAFGIFSKHVHKQLMAEYPDMSAQERTANIAERWKQLPQEYRAQFEAAAAADTARYLAELQLYQQQQQQQRDDHAVNGHGSTTPDGADPRLRAPAHPYNGNGYEMAADGLDGMADVPQPVAADGSFWPSADGDVNSSFTDRPATNKRRPRSHRATQREQPAEVPIPHSRFRWTDGLPVPRSVLSRTPRKPMTAYNVFYKIAYAELSAMHPEATLSQLSQMCSDRWKSLSENEKRPYYDDASTDRARYRQELLDYQNASAAHHRHVGAATEFEDDESA